MSKLIVNTVENTAGTFTSNIDSLGPGTGWTDVGSYGFFFEWNSTTRYPGDTRAGNADAAFFPANGAGDVAASSVISVGTWRCMGNKRGAAQSDGRSTLWVRIS